MKQLGQSATATGSGTTLYTVPTGQRTTLEDLLIANTASSSATFRVHIVPSGGSASTSNAIFYDVTINGNTTIHWEGQQAMTAGGFIQAIGSASGITITASGTEERSKA